MRWTPRSRPPGPHAATARSDQSEVAADQVLAALEEQRSLYARLDELSQTQGRMIESGDSDGLLDVLRQRQEIILEIEAVGRRLAPVKQRWDQFLRSLDADTKQLVQHRLEALTRLAGTVAERDESDRARLAERRDQIARDLGGLNRGRDAASAYRPTGAHGPRYQDREA